MKQFIKPVIVSSLIGLLTACSDGSSGPGVGDLSLGVTDAPVDEAEHVYVQFSGVEVKPKNGDSITIDYYDQSDPPQPTTKTFDLLALRGGLREFLLDGHTLPAGDYSWVRLKVNANADGVYDSYIVISGSQYELNVPSGDESGLKINRPFSIPSGGSVDLTIDFDLRKSVLNPNGATYGGVPVYYLRPTLRMVTTENAGYIHGTLDSAVFTGLSCSAPETGYAVYVFSGSGIMPDDLDGADADPVTTTPLELADSGDYTYRTALLAPGDYTVAATCEADNDDPETDDAINFVGTTSTTVSSDTDPTVNFVP
jgi:hypothetical protein